MVDRRSLDRLRADVGDLATAGMIDHFVEQAPGRVCRLRRAVVAGKGPELRDAALSLGCSASMLGAHQLAAAASRCRSSDPAAAAHALLEVEQVAPRTYRALQSARPGP